MKNRWKESSGFKQRQAETWVFRFDDDLPGFQF